MSLISTHDVRVAGPSDKEEVYRLLRAAHTESGIAPVDMSRVDWWVGRMLEPELIDPMDTGPRGVIGVIGDAGEKLEALVMIAIGCLWYTSQRHLEEMVIYVDPVYRPQRHYRILINWMKEQAIAAQTPLMGGVLSPNGQIEAKIRLYRQAVPQAGAVFRFDPITAGSSRSLMVH